MGHRLQQGRLAVFDGLSKLILIEETKRHLLPSLAPACRRCQGFTEKSADVVCRELGFPGGKRVTGEFAGSQPAICFELRVVGCWGNSDSEEP